MTERERLILIARAKQKQQAEASRPQTNLAEQTGTGTSEGIANMLGMPMDMLNKGLGAVGMPQISNPKVGGVELPIFGTSSLHKQSLDPFMSDVEPQNAAQRIGRRVGQDVGAGAVAAPAAGVASLGSMALNTGADVASGTAGGLVSEVTDNPVVNMIASLLAGGGVVAGAHARRPSGAPSIDELKAQEGRAYQAIEDSDVRLTPDQTQELQGNISARMHDDGMYPPQHVAARGAVERAYELPNRHPEGTPSLRDVEDVRQYINQNVVPSQTAGEGRLGSAMKSEIDEYLAKNLPEEANVARVAHDLSRRRMASEDLASQFEKAGWRAASTGLGGNDINTLRQNVRRMLESNPNGYTAAERAAMEKIVVGTKPANAARMLGALAPQRGAFGMIGAAGAAGAGAATGNMAWAAPAAVGIVAQALGETLTRRQVSNLSEMIRAGKPIPKGLSQGERAVAEALLATQAAQHTAGSQ